MDFTEYLKSHHIKPRY